MKSIFKINLLIILFINNLFALNEIDSSSYINTKNITYNEVTNIIELGENSLININGGNIYTNKGIIDYNNDKIEIFGSFYLYKDKNLLSSESLSGNINLTKFKTNKVSYIFKDDLKIDSQSMERNENKVYFYNNFLTPCRLDGFFNCPTWSLKIPKTLYLINEDQFIHYNSFLQIADKKIFYIPYFSHYGTLADRKTGFLTPSFDFNILNSGISLRTPYYLPLNASTDITIDPKFDISSPNFGYDNDLEVNYLLRSKSSGGDTNVEVINRFGNDDSNFYNSVGIETKQTIDSNHTLELKTLYTNSISNRRSDNDDQLTFTDSFLKINSYNRIFNNDVLTYGISSVTSFDDSQASSIPYQLPLITYKNYKEIDNKNSLYNDINFYILERKDSDDNNAGRNIGINFNNKLVNTSFLNNSLIFNKMIVNNSFRDLVYDNPSLNKSFTQSSLALSSQFNFSFFDNKFRSKLKFILNEDFNTYKKLTNEDSKSITFNYNHLFEENRFFGLDLPDNSKRVAYGVEFEKKINENDNTYFKIGQAYEISEDNDYLNKINQQSNFSDISIYNKTAINNISFNLDGRLNQRNLSKKEMNYGVTFKKYLELSLIYNETSKDAFKDFSDDSKSLKALFSYDINNNIKLNTYTNLDMINDYSPYKSELELIFYDECSEFTAKYTNTKFSDNFKTTPTEVISLGFKMDYLGFFGYEQNTNLF